MVALGAAILLAIPAEGLHRKAYKDPPGVLTVCYGSTRDVDSSRVYSLKECRERLDKEMAAAVDQVERCAPGLPDHVLAAFGDAVYNLGPTIACDVKRSTAARHLRAGRLREACEELPKWNQARIGGGFIALPGLTRRRNAERKLCLQGIGVEP
jgi:GH24 family phage-related lysozyme (muramidase)